MSQSSQQANRIKGNLASAQRRVNMSKPITFKFNNKSYTGYAGDTIASALLANDVAVVGRSFKYGTTSWNRSRRCRRAECNPSTGTNGWPSTERDVMGVMGKVFGRFMPPGFYYKTFMSPSKLWMTYEKMIRKGAGLGRSPKENDPDIYDTINQHADVLVVGGGPAGITAALNAARSGARVILADEQNEFGGNLLSQRELLDGAPCSRVD
ncbi:Sarcosine oxidase subunit alpha [Nymphon striatum]|nr:Sarcosine oxidase subunit alpha [Nymphon striatum]KAG1694649.1 Sarcosine oxidase subunit alpha [Nymphon striatum]